MSYFTKRAEELGINIQQPEQRQPGESYLKQRARELGVSPVSPAPQAPEAQPTGFFQSRAMELGLIPDTRPKPTAVTIPAPNAMSKPQPLTAGQFSNDITKSVQNWNLPAVAAANPVAPKPPSAAGQQLAKNDADRAATGAPKWLQNAAGAFDRFLYQNPVGQGVKRFSQAAAGVFGVTPESVGETQVSTGNKAADKALDIAGGIAGYTVNPSQIEQNLVTGSYGAARSALNTGAGQKIEQGLQNAASRVANRVAPGIAPRVTDRAVSGLLEGGAANALQNAAVGAMAGQTDAKDVARNALIGGAIGGVTDGALSAALGRFVGRQRVSTPETEQQISQLLALPAPRERGNVNTAATPDVIYRNGPVRKPETLAIGPGTYQRPSNLRVAGNNETLNKVMTEIKPIVTERMTPPLENPNELAKWVQQHLGDDTISLNEVRQVPYEGLRQMAEMMRSKLNVADEAAKAASERGYNLPDLLEGKTPSLRGKIDQNAQERVYGVYPESLPNVKKPQMRSEVFNNLASPFERVGRAAEVEPLAKKKPIKAEMPAENIKFENETPKPIEMEPLNPDEIPFSLTDPEDRVNLNDLDDIEVNPEDVAPRVRDRLSGFADDLIANAKAELAKSRNRLSSNPADVYAQYAKVGAGYMLKGAVKLADFTEQMVRDFGEEVRPHVREIFKQAKAQYQVLKKQIESEELGLSGFEGQKLKDLSSLNLNTNDVYRNFKKVFGEHYPDVKKAVLDPFDEAKGAFAKEQHKQTDELYRDVVKGMGIKKGSKLSAVVQQYGEGKLSLDDIKADYPDKYKDIIRADQWFRQRYDDLIDRVNQTIAKIYPNNPDKLVPRRKDYYRHFTEMSDWGGLKSLFDNVNGISPQLAGISPFTQPKTKWASFKQKRGLGEFKNDAVGGFLDYIPAASYAIHIDPHINVFRNLAKRLREDTEQTKNLNNFISFLENYSNDLAGKTAPIDRWADFIDPFTSGGGRKLLRLLTQVNNRVKSNMILGNARSTLSQLANIPNGVAYGGVDAPAGALKTVQSIFEPNAAMEKSNFLKERYLGKTMRQFQQKWWEQPKRFAEWMMEASDRVGTSFVWNTAYAKAVRQGEKNPVKFADEQTRRLVSGRGIGEQPLLLKSKTFNLIAPFQLEVNNLWRVMKDFVDEKRFGALVTLFTANWLLNEAYKKGTGSGVVFDPIDAIYDAASENTNFFNRLGRVGGEVLSNLPFGQTLASIYPEYGTNISGVQLPTREAFFGDKDPTRFGSGLLLERSVTDPVFNFILPFGGGQLKKTIQGADALARGGTYTENVLTTGPKIESPKLKYPVARTPANTLRGLLFNPNATSEGQRYNREDLRPLSEKQTQVFRSVPEPTAYYENIMAQRKAKHEKASQN